MNEHENNNTATKPLYTNTNRVNSMEARVYAHEDLAP
jgi:hypothetical protein